MATPSAGFLLMSERHVSELERVLGHSFSKTELLLRALTHSSHAQESEGETAPETRRDDNEQMEFLGDAVLGFVTSQELFRRFPAYNEGQLSKLKAHLVSAKHLVRAARKLEIGEFLRLGRGEEKTGGRAKAALLVDALEAVLAALYLDAGLDMAREFILREILGPELTRLQEHGTEMPVFDYKSRLLEVAQASGHPQPSYVVLKEEGPEHRKTFTVEARVHLHDDGAPDFAGRGIGPTKKKAEQLAAQQALEKIENGTNQQK